MRSKKDRITHSRNEDSRRIVWEVQPAARHPVKAACAVLMIGMIVGAVHQLTGEMLLTAISLILLLISVSPFFQKTRFEVNDDGILRQILWFTRVLRWNEIKRCCINKQGMYISAFSSETWKDTRGINLLWNGHEEELLAGIEKKLQKNQVRIVSRFQR